MDDSPVEDTELMAAIGRMIVNAAQLEYSVAELVATADGMRDRECQEHATKIVARPGEALRQFRDLAGRRTEFEWLMNDTAGLLKARHFAAHSVAQGNAVADDQPALFVLHPKSGEETMITLTAARDNARMIREGHVRVQDAIKAEISGIKASPSADFHYPIT